MSYPPSQSELIEKALMDTMDNNPEYDKHQIITVVTAQGFPRPSVRRVKENLLIRLIEYAEILK